MRNKLNKAAMLEIAKKDNFIELTPDMINYFKNILINELVNRVNEKNSIVNKMQETSNVDTADSIDIANNFVENGMLGTKANIQNSQVARINRALERIDNDEYGYCIKSGEPIGIKRLLFDPSSEYCIEVAEELEKRAKSFARGV